MKIYTENSEIPYIFIDELPIEEREKFELWLFGSTAPLIGDGSRSTAYIGDYRRWKNLSF